jgi:hypothetical protein
MSFAEQLYDRVAAVAEGTISPSVLHTWLDEHVGSLDEAADDNLDELAERAWALLAELDNGHRTLADVRAELRASLRRAAAPRPI